MQNIFHNHYHLIIELKNSSNYNNNPLQENPWHDFEILPEYLKE